MRQVKVDVLFTGDSHSLTKTFTEEVPAEISRPLSVATALTWDWLVLVIDPYIDIEILDAYLA